MHRDRTASAAGVNTGHIIADFRARVDQIDLASFDADLRVAGVQHFVFDGQMGANTGRVGHVGYHREIMNEFEYTVIDVNQRTAASTTELTPDSQIALLA